MRRVILPSNRFYFTLHALSIQRQPAQIGRYELPQLEKKTFASIPPYAMEANSSNTVIMQIGDQGLRQLLKVRCAEDVRCIFRGAVQMS